MSTSPPPHPQPQQDEDQQQQSHETPNPNQIHHEHTPNQDQHPHPNSPSPSSPIETLEIPSHQNPEKPDLDHPKPQLQDPEESSEAAVDQREDQQNPELADDDDDLAEQSGMSLSLPTPETLVNVSDLNTSLPLASPTHPPRRPNKRKKINVKKQQAIEKKVQTLIENLRPISFVPPKNLDFSKHEKLLRRLGLWDFVHIEFDRIIRVDLLAQLVANYEQKTRATKVNDLRVGINRADLARALKLPIKRDKGGNVTPSEVLDVDSEVLSEESISFIEEIVSNWMFLHEDTWIMPSEVLNWTRTIKDGHPEKVDWAALIWFMVEKELGQGQQLEDCYYASHLQCVIKSQREEFFREEATNMVAEVEVNLVKEEDDGSDIKMVDFQGEDSVPLEEDKIELTLGQDVTVKEEEVKEEEARDEDMVDVEEGKEEEDQGLWLFDGKNSLGEHFLQPCHLEERTCLDSPEQRKQEDQDEEDQEEEEGEELEDGFNLTPNGNDLEGNDLTGNYLQGMETTQIPFGLSGPFHTSKAEQHLVSGGPSFFGNGNKRETVHEHDISHHSLDVGNKRLRTDASWDHKSSDFGMCMEQMQHLMEKARMLHEAKEHACEEANMTQQYLISEVQRRDGVIEHLHKAKMEEVQKRDGDIFRLERELYAMASLLEGYRKALKETQKSFAEYRQRCQIPEEPLYKDAGPGGVVLSVTELEKLRQKKEEEDRLNRLMAERKVKDFEEECINKMDAHLAKVVMLEIKLANLENEVKLLKELSGKPKVSESQDVLLETNDEPLENPPSELGEVQVLNA